MTGAAAGAACKVVDIGSARGAAGRARSSGCFAGLDRKFRALGREKQYMVICSLSGRCNAIADLLGSGKPPLDDEISRLFSNLEEEIGRLGKGGSPW